MTDLKKLAEARLQHIFTLQEEVETLLGQIDKAREEALEEAAKRLDQLAEAWGGDIPFAREKQVTYQAAAESVRALKHTGEDGETKP